MTDTFIQVLRVSPPSGASVPFPPGAVRYRGIFLAGRSVRALVLGRE